MSRRAVIGLFTIEGALLGSVGSALGIVAGIALSRASRGDFERIVSELFAQVRSAELLLELPLILGCFLSGVACTTVAALLAAREAARVAPSEALRGGRHLALAERRRHVRDVAAFLAALSSLGLLIFPSPRHEALSAALSCVTIVLAHVLFMPRLVQLLSLAARGVLSRWAGMDLCLANDNLRKEVDRASATASALMLGVAMSLAFSSLVDSFTSSTMTWVDQMLPADLWVTSGARMAGGNSLPMTDTLRGPLARLPGVAFVERLRMVDVDLTHVGTAASSARVKLIAMDTDALGGRARLVMVDGAAADAKRRLRGGEVLISENLARRHGLSRGDTLVLPTARGQKRFRVAAVIVDYTSDQGTVLLDRARYEADFADARVDSYKLYLKPGAASEPVRHRIYARWGQSLDLSVLTQRELRAQIRELLGQTFGLMHGLELSAVLIAVLSVVNAVFANVLDRAREYGLLRAVGMLRAQVERMIVAEAALIGVIGALAGVLAGLAIGYVLLAHLNVAQTGWHLPYRPTFSLALAAALPVVVAAAAAGYYPARVASRHALINALAYE
jgi:putative ABC transport system permease protein